MAKVDIAVLISVRNEEGYIGSTIQSILDQTYRNFELWVIDDGSTDKTWKVIKSFKDKRIRQFRFKESTGMTPRLNWAIPQIKTEFVARMDSHNLADKTRLKKQHDFMLQNPRIMALGSNFIRIDETGKKIMETNYPTEYKDIKKKLIEKNIFKHGAMFIRREVYDKVGLYDPYFKLTQDYDFILRVAGRFPVANLKEPLVTEIYRSQNMTQKHRVRSSWEAFVSQWNALTKYGYTLFLSVYLLRGVAFLIKSFLFSFASNKEDLLIFGIVVLAIITRFWNLTNNFVFSLEENNVLYSLEKFINHTQSPLLGLEATGYVHHLFHTPWYVYVFSTVLRIGGSEPLIFSYLQAFFGTMAVIVWFLIGCRLKMRKMGVIAALLTATSFYFISIDRTAWAVGLIPFVTTLAVFLGINALVTRKTKWLVLLGVCLGFGLSLHYQMLIPVVGFFLWGIFIFKQRVIYILMPVLISLIPLIIFDLRHDFFNAVGFGIAINTILKGGSSYSSGHYLYVFAPFAILLSSWVLSKVNRILLIFVLSLYLLMQLYAYTTWPVIKSYPHKNNVVNSILGTYNGNKIEVFFKNGESFEYRYLLFLRAKQRGISSDKITIYEPWQASNSASLMIESGKLVNR